MPKENMWNKIKDYFKLWVVYQFCENGGDYVLRGVHPDEAQAQARRQKVQDEDYEFMMKPSPSQLGVAFMPVHKVLKMLWTTRRFARLGML